MAKKNRFPAIVAALGLIPAAGCGWLFPGGPPEKAHIEITSEDVDQLTVFLSQNFRRYQEPTCEGEPDCPVILIILDADTLEVEPPYSNTIEFTDRYQILVETYPTDEVEAIVGMKVDIDGREWYDDIGRLRATNESGERESMRFIYQFHSNQTQNSDVR